MSATVERDPRQVVHLGIVRYRREGCRLAAMILLSEPERIGDEPISDFLRRIENLKLERIYEWLRRAGINPLRPGNQLRYQERQLLAGLLVQYSKGQSA